MQIYWEENKVIQVLMSTYNGKDYLREQIDSILAQNCKEQMGVSLKLFIRDDGSKDGTQKILDEYAEKYPDKISWYQGENIGVIKSFFELIEKSDEKVEYYAFSDQDDYWHKEKLSAGIKQIKNKRLIVADALLVAALVIAFAVTYDISKHAGLYLLSGEMLVAAVMLVRSGKK